MISVKHLTKYYGEHLAVNDISFEITEGHVYGFLGPNGAGKSTTMNIITGCLSATDGTVLVDGHDIFEEPDDAKRLIGYLPEHPPLYMNESPWEYLRFVGEAKGLHGAVLTKQINEVMERTGITNVKDRRIAALSKGYKQRVGIAQALLGNPKVIILDEPTVGLDPIQIIEIRELITELGKTHTVIFSSHILSEVQAICDQIIMIAHGQLVAFGKPEELQKQLLNPGEVVLTTDASEAEVRKLLANVDHITELTVNAIADNDTVSSMLQVNTNGTGKTDSAPMEDTSDQANAPVSAQTDAATAAQVKAATSVSAQQSAPSLNTVHIQSDLEDIYALSGAVFHAFAPSGRTLYEMTLKKGSLEDIFIELSENAPATSTEDKKASTGLFHRKRETASDREHRTAEPKAETSQQEAQKEASTKSNTGSSHQESEVEK